MICFTCIGREHQVHLCKQTTPMWHLRCVSRNTEHFVEFADTCHLASALSCVGCAIRLCICCMWWQLTPLVLFFLQIAQFTLNCSCFGGTCSAIQHNKYLAVLCCAVFPVSSVAGTPPVSHRPCKCDNDNFAWFGRPMLHNKNDLSYGNCYVVLVICLTCIGREH